MFDILSTLVTFPFFLLLTLTFVMEGSEEHKLKGQRYQSAQPDSTYREHGAYSASKTSLRSCSPEAVCSESQQFLPTSNNFQAQSCLSSPHESLHNPSCSQPNDLNVVSNPQPTPGSGSNMTFPVFYSPFMQPVSAPGVSWLPYGQTVWFPPTTMVPGPQGVVSINPYMQPFGSGGMPNSPYLYPPCVPPAATPGLSSIGNGSSSSSESESKQNVYFNVCDVWRVKGKKRRNSSIQFRAVTSFSCKKFLIAKIQPHIQNERNQDK